MSWTWLVEEADGKPASLDEAPPEFTSQADAESWLGEIWRELATAGATQVSLLEDGRRLYGPMSLSED
ncbi:MAG TPA: hypothetical protein VFI30_05460 [Nocardioidaceae bacterium]|nr:hypothetical protein [Nocardioidaceae bacterium]